MWICLYTNRAVGTAGACPIIKRGGCVGMSEKGFFPKMVKFPKLGGENGCKWAIANGSIGLIKLPKIAFHVSCPRQWLGPQNLGSCLLLFVHQKAHHVPSIGIFDALLPPPKAFPSFKNTFPSLFTVVKSLPISSLPFCLASCVFFSLLKGTHAL